MIYQASLYSRDEIQSAHPEVSSIGGYVFAKVFSTRADCWSGLNTVIVEFSDLYAWNHQDLAPTRVCRNR